MSGHKRATVTISQEEYRRLYDAENRNYFTTLTIPDQSFNQTIQSSQNKLLGNFHEIAERQDKYEKVINQYQDKLRDIEVATTQSLYDQQVDFYNQLLGMSDLVWSNASDLIKVQSQEFEANVIAQNQHLLAQIQGLDQKMNWFNQREDKLYAAAVNWLNDVELLTNYIYTNFPRELVDQYILRDLQNQVLLAHRNLEDGFYEASLSISQHLFLTMSQIRLELENQFTLRNTLLQVINDKFTLLSVRCSACQEVNAIDMEGNNLPEFLDVNYWTDQALSGLTQDLLSYWEKVRSAGVSLSISDLEKILNTQIPDYSDQLVDIVNSARRNALNSQLRYNVAQMVMLAVMNQGYQPRSGAYSEEDFRQGYLAKAVSPDGSEIIVKVEPGGDFKNELQLINKNPGFINEMELRKRSIEIMQSLEAYGMDVGNIEQMRETKNNPQSRLPGKVQKKKQEMSTRGSLYG